MARYIHQMSVNAPPQANPREELLAALTKLTKDYPPETRHSKHELHGIYSGPTSIALLFFHLFYSAPDLIIGGRPSDHWCYQYLASEPASGRVTSDRCGIANETLSHCAIAAALSHDEFHIQMFLSFIPTIISSSGSHRSHSRPASNEWLYGRAGTLYLLRFMRHYNPTLLSAKIDDAIEQVTSTIISEGPNWEWHGKQYLGAVHGSIGILTQILLTSEKARTQRPEAWVWLETLLKAQLPSGNWISRTGNEKDELVHFCHGAPGFVVSFDALANCTNSIDVDVTTSPQVAKFRNDLPNVLEAARKCVYQRGLLRKEPCLCHGVSGNALALVGEEREQLMQWAQEELKAQWLSEGKYSQGDDPWGLFGGEAGRAWSWMVLLGLGKGMIGYTDV